MIGERAFHNTLLAESSQLDQVFQRMGDGLRADQTGAGTAQLMLGLIALVAMILFGWVLLRAASPQTFANSPRWLFLGLCRAHRLAWAETWLLWRMARARHLNEPARLFLEPEWLEPGDLPESLRSRAEQLRSLRARLFVGLGA